MLDDDLAVRCIPKLPRSVATRRCQRFAIGTPCQRVAAVGVSLLEKMERLALRGIVNGDLAGDRTDGELRAIRRPGQARVKIVQLAVPDEGDCAETG